MLVFARILRLPTPTSGIARRASSDDGGLFAIGFGNYITKLKFIRIVGIGHDNKYYTAKVGCVSIASMWSYVNQV